MVSNWLATFVFGGSKLTDVGEVARGAGGDGVGNVLDRS